MLVLEWARTELAVHSCFLAGGKKKRIHRVKDIIKSILSRTSVDANFGHEFANNPKAILENELDSLSDAMQLSDADLQNVAGMIATPTGHCITGPYTPQCGTNYTICGACYTLLSPPGQTYCDVVAGSQ